ncbi:MAG: UvrD-helicase domain-containing protein [Chlamydiae bacterium]|nr:UvrD-helicase domain-containing protein [Chlamydiota bacterium]
MSKEEVSITLNPEQLEAIHHSEGSALVVAGAGSGKTRVVTLRIAHLIKMGIAPSSIIALTFTNKAAEEMKRRVEELTSTIILTATFHSFCARILRESIDSLGYLTNFSIFDEEDSEKILKECLKEKGVKEEKSTVKTFKTGISQIKNQLIDSFSDEEKLLKEIYELYQTKLKKTGALDFDDLLFLTVVLFREKPEILKRCQMRWRYILIDEYQDTNHAQHVIVKMLSGEAMNVFAVGDPDQSIYSWRGANISNIIHFQKDFPGAKIISLQQNFRSKDRILKGANYLIAQNKNRFEKNLWSSRGEGDKIGLYFCEAEEEEVAFVIERIKKHGAIPLNQCAILYRTHFQSRAFEDGLLREKIPYQIIGGISFYMRKEIKDILSFLRIVSLNQDYVSFVRALGLYIKGIGEMTLAKLRLFSEEHNLDIVKSCQLILETSLSFKLSQKQKEGLKKFIDLLQSLKTSLEKNSSIHSFILEVVEKTGYIDLLKEDPETFQDRRDNLQELLAKAVKWEEEVDAPSLSLFLEELALKPNSEMQSNESLQMMTLHNAKGLEFHLCFIVGMEEEIFPHINAFRSELDLEEERRLCYVGMTRAKDHLYLTGAKKRFLWGSPRFMRPSRFLFEIPSHLIHSFSFTSFQEEKRESLPTQKEGKENFSPGDQVHHGIFGNGVVKKSYQTSLGLTYDVYFPKENSAKSLVAKYAKLSRLR